MSGHTDEYLDLLRQRLSDCFRLKKEPLTSIGTSDLIVARNVVSNITWTLGNGPIFLLENLRNLSRIRDHFDYSDDEIVSDLIAFAFDLGQELEPSGLGEVARSLVELCSVRNHRVRVGYATGGCATDAVFSLTLQLIERLRMTGFSWFLTSIHQLLPDNLEHDGKTIALVVEEAVRARELEATGREYPGFTKEREWPVRELTESEIRDWTPCFERMRASAELLARYQRKDLFEVVEPLKALLRGFNVHRINSELDLEFSKAARMRNREGIPLNGRPATTADETDMNPPSKEWHAIGLLNEHPDWSDIRIAEAVGVNRTTLYTWKNFRIAKAALKASKFQNRRGWKNHRGDVETWEADE